MKQLSKTERDICVYALRYSFQRSTGVIVDVGEYFLDHIKSFEEWELYTIYDEMKLELKMYSESMPKVCRNQVNFILIRISEELHERKELLGSDPAIS
jgi:hypothetical protein